MKTRLLRLITMIAIMIMSSGILLQAQERTSEESKPMIFEILEGEESQVTIEVPEIKGSVIVNYVGLEIKSIESVTKEFDLEWTKAEVEEESGLMAAFQVGGHPDGPCTIRFKEVVDNSTAARQKNRRVEMTIEFD